MKQTKLLEQAIEKGLPIQQAFFHTAISNSDRVPETEFNAASSKEPRRVQMWLTQLGLVCLHKEEYFIVPITNVMRMS